VTWIAAPVLRFQICAAVHVGAIACDNGAVPSDRVNVVATPLTAMRPIVPVGLAPVAVPGAWHEPSARRKVVALQVPDHRPMISALADVVKPVPLPLRTPLSVVVTPKVPDPVTGDPVTLKPLGIVSPTLVTLPVATHEPSPRKKVVALQVPDHREIMSLDTAAVVIGELALPFRTPVTGPNCWKTAAATRPDAPNKIPATIDRSFFI
jgi:hypothetical protein